jgi:hypothetical protein
MAACKRGCSCQAAFEALPVMRRHLAQYNKLLNTLLEVRSWGHRAAACLRWLIPRQVFLHGMPCPWKLSCCGNSSQWIISWTNPLCVNCHANMSDEHAAVKCVAGDAFSP